jgi:HSP20 family protein
MRWNPARELVSIRDDMNRLFNEFFGRTEGQEGTWLSGAWTPPVDIHETDDALILRAELPGFSKDDVNVELKDNSLTLKGQRQNEKEVKEEQYHRRERAYGSFQRTFMLPATVDPEKVPATRPSGFRGWLRMTFRACNGRKRGRGGTCWSFSLVGHC